MNLNRLNAISGNMHNIKYTQICVSADKIINVRNIQSHHQQTDIQITLIPACIPTHTHVSQISIDQSWVYRPRWTRTHLEMIRCFGYSSVMLQPQQHLLSFFCYNEKESAAIFSRYKKIIFPHNEKTFLFRDTFSWLFTSKRVNGWRNGDDVFEILNCVEVDARLDELIFLLANRPHCVREQKPKWRSSLNFIITRKVFCNEEIHFLLITWKFFSFKQ